MPARRKKIAAGIYGPNGEKQINDGGGLYRVLIGLFKADAAVANIVTGDGYDDAQIKHGVDRP